MVSGELAFGLGRQRSRVTRFESELELVGLLRLTKNGLLPASWVDVPVVGHEGSGLERF